MLDHHDLRRRLEAMAARQHDLSTSVDTQPEQETPDGEAEDFPQDPR